MNLKFSILLPSLLAITFTAIGAQAANKSPWKIIGTDDLIAVDATGSNVPEKYTKIIDAFGILSMGCTGTHIGDGLVLTAGHCFWGSEDLQTDLDCSDTTIKWGVREGVEPYLESKCEKILFQRVGDHGSEYSDFAVIKVSPAPKAKVDIDIEKKAAVGDAITIFSHPEELPLRWSQNCKVAKIDETDPDFTNFRLPENSMLHDCDTNPGSSGASIIDSTTMKIIAIHDGGRLVMPRRLEPVIITPPIGVDPISGDLIFDDTKPFLFKQEAAAEVKAASILSKGMNYGTFLTNSDVREAITKARQSIAPPPPPVNSPPPAVNSPAPIKNSPAPIKNSPAPVAPVAPPVKAAEFDPTMLSFPHFSAQGAR